MDNCKLVEDILPTYIEKMTSKETTEFVDKHLEGCENCKKILDSMKENIEKENLENLKIVKEIKKYKRKIKILKSFVILILLLVIGSFTGNIGYRYYVLYNALEKNTNYDIGSNYAFIEYESALERYPNPTITYHQDGFIKKVKGDKVLEYSDDVEYYYIDEETKTYKVSNDIDLLKRDRDLLTIDLSKFEAFKNVFKENGEINKFEILKIALDSKIKIWKEGFRNKEYQIIKTEDGEDKIYFDENTFLAERLIFDGIEYKEYRVIPAIVTYRERQKPDLTNYTKKVD